MRFHRIFAGFVALSCSTQFSMAEEPPAFVQFVRPLGMGGAFTAVADDHNVFTFNPAGMVQRTGAEVTILDVAVGASKDLKTAYDFISDNEEDLTNIETSPRRVELINEIRNEISKLAPRVYVAADVASFVSGPRFFGLPVHGGFGLMGVADARFALKSNQLIPSISYSVHNDIVLPISLAKRWDAPWIPGRFAVGVTGKFLRRNQIKEDNLSIAEIEDLEAPPLTTGRGFGTDLGFLYQPTERWNVGVMVRDFMGTKITFDAREAEEGYPAEPSRSGIIKSQSNVGLAFTPKRILWLLPTGERWMFSADIRDILNKDDHVLFQNGFRKPFGENFGTHAHLGAEFRYWFLRFRGGAYQGYPSVGLGIDIPILKLDYAFYSLEKGPLAGDKREENHVISLALRFGTGNTEARERIRKAKDNRRQNDDAISTDDDASSRPEPSRTEPQSSGSGKGKSKDMPQETEEIPR